MLEIICKELGIGFYKEWLANDGHTYMVDRDDGVLRKVNTLEKWALISGDCYRDILQGKIRPVWKPKEDEEYYVPYVSWKEEERYDCWEWESSNNEYSLIDQWYFDNQLVFKSKEEAIEATNQMIELYKEGK